MELKQVKIDELKEHPKNPRVHPDSALDKLVNSIKEYGWTNPVLVSKDGYILAGHARCKAAKKAGLEEVPAIYLDLEGDKANAYLIADNKIQEETDWDFPLLADLIKDLEENNFDVSLTGFTAAEIDDLFSQVHDKDAEDDDYDVNQALEEAAFVEEGDIWYLGRHRLMCGDSTKEENVTKLMNGAKANLLVTDPPYNVDFKSSSGLKIKNDKQDSDSFYEFLLSAFKACASNMALGASAYVFHADTEGLNFRKAFIEAGFHLSGVCIWKKNSLVLGRSPYNWIHEPILFGWLKGGKHKWFTGRSETTVWNYDKPKKNGEHPTMKPIPLLCYPIKNSSQVNGIVLDTFGGSGSTLIACEQIDRICYTMELDPKYASVIVRRYIEQVSTDKDVYVIRDGVKIPFKEVAKSDNQINKKSTYNSTSMFGDALNGEDFFS